MNEDTSIRPRRTGTGTGTRDEEGMEAGAVAGAEGGGRLGGVHVLTEEEGWDVLEDIPNDSAAPLVLLEHPLGGAASRHDRPRPGASRISDGFISPLDLVEIRLASAEEAQELHDLGTSAAASTP